MANLDVALSMYSKNGKEQVMSFIFRALYNICIGFRLLQIFTDAKDFRFFVDNRAYPLKYWVLV